jgi:hypothetical protein
MGDPPFLKKLESGRILLRNFSLVEDNMRFHVSAKSYSISAIYYF